MAGRRVHRRSDVAATAMRGLAAGAKLHSPIRQEWELSRNCERPIWTQREGRPTRADRASGRKTPLFVELWVPCRQCAPCLRSRAARWRYRAEHEVGAAARTWFGTITLSPDWHYIMECRADRRQTAKGNRWRELSSAERFAAIHAEISRELTLWLKRVREQSGSPLRYLLVAEAHKTGRPHYHVLIHEVSNWFPVRHAVLSGQWKLGFTNFKLVDDGRCAAYVCKYLSKSSLARVRASVRYGKYDPSESLVIAGKSRV